MNADFIAQNRPDLLEKNRQLEQIKQGACVVLFSDIAKSLPINNPVGHQIKALLAAERGKLLDPDYSLSLLLEELSRIVTSGIESHDRNAAIPDLTTDMAEFLHENRRAK